MVTVFRFGRKCLTNSDISIWRCRLALIVGNQEVKGALTVFEHAQFRRGN